MTSNRMRVLLTGVAAAMIGIYAETGFSSDQENGKKDSVDVAVAKGLKWLVSVQGKDGGWGQDGGETSYARQGEHLESNGNDLANTAVAATALLRAGGASSKSEYQAALMHAVDFILRRVDESPAEGLAVTTVH